MSGIVALIVAAGRGERVGGEIPKQYRNLAGLPVWRRSAERFLAHPRVSTAIVVISREHERLYGETRGALDLLPPVFGGASRQSSVRAGLEALERLAPEFVMIHDAARPLATAVLIDRVLGGLEDADASVPVLPVTDTLRTRNATGAWISVPRDGVFRAQTPQAFHFEKILAAHRRFSSEDVTDDMAIAQLAGMKINTVPGDEGNMKITGPDDFAIAERLLGTESRVGFGFDAHRFAVGDHVWLCGIRIPHSQGLEGHSDADAGLHALTDAILGAIAAGDIGAHFPPTDAKWRGASSAIFLEHAAKLVHDSGAQISHCDITLIAEQPKIAPHRDAMRARIADILGIESSRISVKATTTEGMGFTGRREGVAAQAVATITIPLR